MYLIIKYFPNGFYNGKTWNNFKQYKLYICHHLGYDGHDFPFYSEEINKNKVISILSQIRQHRENHLIIMDKNSVSGIKKFTIKTII